MDPHLNKIAAALIAVFSLTLLAQILYLLCRRRPRAGGATGCDDSDSVVVVKVKECGFRYFCWRNQSRIAPKQIASRLHDDPEAEAADEVEKWRQLCGPPRFLFTINEAEEEEIREGIESFERRFPDPDTTPFHTPCASPPYSTPSPSPTRRTADFPADESSSAGHNRTAPFSAVEIRTH